MSTFEQLVVYGKEHPILAALYASLFTWGLTALGASLVFFFKKLNRAVLDGMLGFTGGVMVAASFWSLLSPAIENSPGEGFVKVIPAAIGFALGALSLFGMDKILPHLHINFKENEAEGVKTEWHKTTLLVLAITLHNIPEGLAVGVLFGAASTLVGVEQTEMIIAAISLAIGNWNSKFSRRFCSSNAFTKTRSLVDGKVFGMVSYLQW
jgi:ZIP family zinc transporter